MNSVKVKGIKNKLCEESKSPYKTEAQIDTLKNLAQHLIKNLTDDKSILRESNNFMTPIQPVRDNTPKSTLGLAPEKNPVLECIFESAVKIHLDTEPQSIVSEIPQEKKKLKVFGQNEQYKKRKLTLLKEMVKASKGLKVPLS